MSTKFGDVIANLEALAEAAELETDEDQVQAAETETEVTDAVTEADTAEAAIDSSDTAMADAENAEDTIAELTNVAEDSLAGDNETVAEGEVGEEGPGLTEQEATTIEITHESILNHLGMNYSARPRLTAENFKGDDRRVQTLEALEGLKESASKIGKGLVAALKSALGQVLGFLAGLMKNRDLMRRHLSNLYAQLKGISGGQKAKETLTAGAAALSVDGKASVQTAELLMAQGDKMVAICEVTASALGQPGTDLSKVHTGEFDLAYGRKMTVSTDEKGVKFEVKDTGKAKEIAAPDQAQMRKLLGGAVNLLKTLSGFEKTQNKLKSAVQGIIDRVTRFADKTKAAISKDGGSEENKAAAAAKEDARKARAVMRQIGGTMPSAVFQVIKGVADFVKAGIANYKGGEAPAGGNAGGAAPAGGGEGNAA